MRHPLKDKLLPRGVIWLSWLPYSAKVKQSGVARLLNKNYVISIYMLGDEEGERVLTWPILTIQYVFADIATSQEASSDTNMDNL